MKILFTLDYELFFGRVTGTPDGCLIYPTRVLTDLLDHYGCRLTLFVDAGYLVRLGQSELPMHKRQYERVCSQLVNLVNKGHDVQLHIHPHWEDSRWEQGQWKIDTTRYRLHDFATPEMQDIARRYSSVLKLITGIAPVAFRAGGWCIQPFQSISKALWDAGIRIDSTVYARGSSVNVGREFNFLRAPQRDHWRFEDDPLVATENGRFLEIPITAQRLSPLFYWRALWAKIARNPEDLSLGDGQALGNSGEYYFRKLFIPEDAVASIDGIRASTLDQAYEGAVRRGDQILNVMGHPKSLTRRSLSYLEAFLKEHAKRLEPAVLSDFVSPDAT